MGVTGSTKSKFANLYKDNNRKNKKGYFCLNLVPVNTQNEIWNKIT